MKVLDLFCGMGGWSKPFIEDGDEVWGIDVKDFHYPGILIKEDIRALDGYGFGDMDLIIGSPPCSEFSKAKENRRTTPSLAHGECFADGKVLLSEANLDIQNRRSSYAPSMGKRLYPSQPSVQVPKPDTRHEKGKVLRETARTET